VWAAYTGRPVERIARGQSNAVSKLDTDSAFHRDIHIADDGLLSEVPGRVKVTVASQSWPLGKTSYWDTPDGDRMESDSAGFRGTSQALAAGQSEAEWISQYIASSMPCGNREQVPVGAFVGTIDLNDCPGMGRLGGRVFDIAVVAGGRGYNFTMEGQVDRNFFLAMLATVTFTPQTVQALTP